MLNRWSRGSSRLLHERTRFRPRSDQCNRAHRARRILFSKIRGGGRLNAFSLYQSNNPNATIAALHVSVVGARGGYDIVLPETTNIAADRVGR